MYSVIAQFPKFAAGEQLCHRCTHSTLRVAHQNLQKILLKNHRFWVVTLLSQMSHKITEFVSSNMNIIQMDPYDIWILIL
jgi:hypothetical protein